LLVEQVDKTLSALSLSCNLNVKNIMKLMMLEMLLWLATTCGQFEHIHQLHFDPCKLKYDVALPKIMFMTKQEMQYDWSYGNPSSVNSDIAAYYKPHKKAIVLPHSWNKNNKWDQSDLIHELFHHIQQENGINFNTTCDSHFEIPAYTIQLAWVKIKHKTPAKSKAINYYKNLSCNTKY